MTDPHTEQHLEAMPPHQEAFIYPGRDMGDLILSIGEKYAPVFSDFIEALDEFDHGARYLETAKAVYTDFFRESTPLSVDQRDTLGKLVVASRRILFEQKTLIELQGDVISRSLAGIFLEHFPDRGTVTIAGRPYTFGEGVLMRADSSRFKTASVYTVFGNLETNLEASNYHRKGRWENSPHMRFPNIKDWRDLLAGFSQTDGEIDRSTNDST